MLEFMEADSSASLPTSEVRRNESIRCALEHLSEEELELMVCTLASGYQMKQEIFSRLASGMQKMCMETVEYGRECVLSDGNNSIWQRFLPSKCPALRCSICGTRMHPPYPGYQQNAVTNRICALCMERR